MKQLLILSSSNDISTTHVMRWIQYLNADVELIRLHAESLINGIAFIDFSDKNGCFEIEIGDRVLKSDEIGAVWTRKWDGYNQILTSQDKLLAKQLPTISKNLKEEFNALFDYLLYSLEQNESIYWLNRYKEVSPNKLIQLKIAEDLGLTIPKTYVGNTFSESVLEKQMITKSLSDCMGFRYGDGFYNDYTSRITESSSQANLFHSYLQEEIPKLLELRVFYLAGNCYTASILSQGNSQTKVDYRRYDHQRRNRVEKYALPISLEEKITVFMQQMNLQTGSLDFILTPEGKFVFLEVNPCGQYDLFNLCNVYPDKLIAEHLISKIS